MNDTDFLEAYSEIIRVSCKKLKDDRFAVVVVGDIRDNKGAYRDFVSETKRIFHNNGLYLYNEMVLLEQYGTAQMRASLVFNSKRKLVKVHQNILVFYKGNINKIKENYTEKSFDFVDLSKYK
jgi:hypothetical protein